VLQVLDAFRKFSVLRLERTFAALSIPEVALRASLEDKSIEEVEPFVASLIASGELKGTLLQSSDHSQPTILRFTTSPSDSFSETQIKDDLAAQKQRLTKLLALIQASDHKLELGREYVENLRRDRKRKIATGKEGALSTAPGIGVGGNGEFEFDEDMMADLQ
jgi:COP9 signalosome complex subunit 3